MSQYDELTRLVERVLKDRRFCGDEHHLTLATGVSVLLAEVAGLRTGYEAYEQVNAELKAEVDRLNEEYDKAWRHDLNDKKNVQALAAEVARLSADSEALRKDAERYRMVRGIASISAGRRHLVVKRLPVNGFGSSTARDFDASIDAALGQGEQS